MNSSASFVIVALVALISTPFGLMAGANLRKLYAASDQKNPNRHQLQTEVADNRYAEHEPIFWAVVAIAALSDITTIVLLLLRLVSL